MQEKWKLMPKADDCCQIAEHFGIDPVIAQAIRNRGVVGEEAVEKYLHGGISQLEDPFCLKDMDKAVRILKDKIKENALIRVIGDYDIDGIMASYILKRGISELGGRADIRIPNRVRDGYGMNESLIGEAESDGVDTILTCDNGISAHAAVALAREKGMSVIITDHHEVMELPDADAVVDPKREDDNSPNPNLCGAAIAWKLILALGGDPELRMLQYAAFATVGDIVELSGENRILVKEGIRQLRSTDNIGLKALCAASNISAEAISTYHIGFILGPCLNASGRLDSAMRGLELLEAESETAAKRCAEELKELNDSRKGLTESGVREAVDVIREEGLAKDKILVVYLPDVHESIAGIIAGRIREKYMRPAFVLTRAQEGVKGSGRSTENYSMFEELTKVKDLLLKFGGHPMAAGLTLREENLPELRRRLNENCPLSEEDLVPVVHVDALLPVSCVRYHLIEQLEMLEPYGKGNEKPLFADTHVFCDHPRIFGAKHTLLRTRVRSLHSGTAANGNAVALQHAVKGPEFDAISFRNVDELNARIAASPDVALVYEAALNDYLGQKRIQLVIHHFR